MSMRRGLITACILGAVIAYGARVAEAALLIDLRETGTGFKEAWLTSGDLNKPISIDVFVRVIGAAGNPAPEMFSILQGSFISPEGAIGEIAPAGYYDKLRKQQHAGMKYESYGFIA